MKNSNGQRVLLGQLAARGDCVYATAIARQIKEDFPGCHLTWAIGSMCRDIVRANPHVDEVWEFPVEGHGDAAAAWRSFAEEARERIRRGEFDHAFFTQVFPDNFGRFDGTVRSSIFRGYPHPITVPVEPVIRLEPDEVESVDRFAERHWLWDYEHVILFECASHSGQSFVTIDYATEVARAVRAERPDVACVLSSHLPLPTNEPGIVDGSALTFRENVELTKYCSLLIGCSSGISWLCTSDWAKPLPMMQLLRRDTSIFASMVHDYAYRGEEADHVIEITDCPPEHIASCAIAVLEEGVAAARPRYHERLPIHFNHYAWVICTVLKDGQWGQAIRSIGLTIRRYGPRPGIVLGFIRVVGRYAWRNTLAYGRRFMGKARSWLTRTIRRAGRFLYRGRWFRRARQREAVSTVIDACNAMLTPLCGRTLSEQEHAFVHEEIARGTSPSVVVRTLFDRIAGGDAAEWAPGAAVWTALEACATRLNGLGPNPDDQERVAIQIASGKPLSTVVAEYLLRAGRASGADDDWRVGTGDAPDAPVEGLAFPVLPGTTSELFEIDIVDVGSEALDFEDDVYAPLTAAGPCRIIGFDPFADPHIAERPEGTDADAGCGQPGRTTLPYFVGDGRDATFHVNHFTATSSLYPANGELLNDFSDLIDMLATERTVPVQTHRLDDVEEVRACDYLKLDTQGSEMEILQHATRRVLGQTLLVHLEAEFVDIYRGQRLFADTDRLLRSRGFEFLDFVKPGYVRYKSLTLERQPSRLLWSDCLYMKSPSKIAERDPRLLLRLAYIVHVNYAKYDLAAHLIHRYDEHTGGDAHRVYTTDVLNHELRRRRGRAVCVGSASLRPPHDRPPHDRPPHDRPPHDRPRAMHGHQLQLRRYPIAVAHILWLHRDLIWPLTKRDVIGRYRGSAMGLLWSFINPLFMLAVYAFVFGVVFKPRWVVDGNSEAHFVPVLFVGMIITQLFGECAVHASRLIVGNVNYVKKIVFPLEALAWSTVLAALFHAAASFAVLLLFAVILGSSIGWSALLLPLIIAPLTLYLLGAIWFISAISVFIRDVEQSIGILTSLALFLSPVFYPVSALPEPLQKFLYLNPLTYAIEESRHVVLFGELPNWSGLALYAVIGIAVACLGLRWFQAARKGFADVL